MISGHSSLYSSKRLPITLRSHYTLAPSERDIEVHSTCSTHSQGWPLPCFTNVESGLQYTKKTQEWACKLHTLYASIFKNCLWGFSTARISNLQMMTLYDRTGEIKTNSNPLGFSFYPWDFFFNWSLFPNPFEQSERYQLSL